jgi:signal transduction histidine kinase
VDPFALRQVFRNILENSLAACTDPVEIRVSYLPDRLDDQDALTVRIRDNGPGLSAEECRRAFDSFYTTKTKGTGLGLAISKRIVGAHQGQIAANPDCQDGAEFLVTLPRRKP